MVSTPQESDFTPTPPTKDLVYNRIYDEDSRSDSPQPEGKPPPYTRSRDTSQGLLRRTAAPVASVNQPHLRTHKEPLKGTFYIDPTTPCLAFDPKAFKSRKKNPPHASFHTRKGEINLDLATVGDANISPKASVLVASRSGNIKIKLLPTPVKRPRVDLEVTSRKGKIVLFLPETFSGLVQLKSRKGKFCILPELAAVMTKVKQGEGEIIFFIGEQPSATARAVVDFCQLESRGGKLIVGLDGLDIYESKVGGFRRKLFGGCCH
ncbi:hypothetical protein BDZ94DRAFT_1196090 [Collybia nuda]|uniref:DUF7330 domain-containing protein n=1 Tax=Collybia nuda TaxID=64659 RepID=A0A9P5Y3C8_9AGAR|nr:hypothetical protein BDZ94DRAFT_1196090 [Collybia nuda]